MLQPIPVDTPIKYSEEIKYIVSSQHRNRQNDEKSIWTINPAGEYGCFCEAIANEWVQGTTAWGHAYEDDQFAIVGVNPLTEYLYLAKFVSNSGDWHGYPADYRRKVQDRPSAAVLEKWLNIGRITKAQMSKVRSGKKCNL